MGQDATGDGIMNNGVIHIGYFKNWHQLSNEDKDKVIAERACTGTAHPGEICHLRGTSRAWTN